jgi:hypothetical protein
MPHLDNPTDRIWNTVGPVHYIALRWNEVARENDWRPSQGAVCIAALLGKRCRHFRPSGPRCVCDEVASRFGARIDDHARRWIAPDGSPVITFEPYNMADDPSIAEFRAFCADHGLTVEIGDRSPWSPGDTVLLTVRAIRR